MIRTALIALDGSAASQVATELAISYVKRRTGQRDDVASVSLTGIAVLDRPTITKPQATPLGGGAFKRERDEAMLAEADRKGSEILEQFKSACEAGGVDHTTQRAEGLPYEAIAEAGLVHDLIVIGRDTNFHFQTSDDPCETFRCLLRDHPCPVVVTPKHAPKGNAIMVAYGGSREASRALHTFALTGFNLENQRIHVVSVDRNEEQAQKHCTQAVEFLRRHGIEAEAHPKVSGGHPTSILNDMAVELDVRLVVMGAYGRKGLQALFFGSTTRGMLDQCQLPLFLY